MLQALRKILFRIFHGLWLKDPAISHVQDTDSCIQKIVNYFSEIQRNRLLIIVPAPAAHYSFFHKLKEQAIKANLHVTVYDSENTKPTISTVEQCLHKYYSSRSEAILILGGNPQIDLGKAVKARLLNPQKSIYKIYGFGRVRHRHREPVLVLATASLAGKELNGSTFILDHTNQVIFPLFDKALQPDYVLYCPELILNLNKQTFFGNMAFSLGILCDILTSFSLSSAVREKARAALSLSLQSLSEFLALDLENPENIKEAYTLTRNLQDASALTGQISRRALPGYFQLLIQALQIEYNFVEYKISPFILSALLDAYLHFLGDQTISEKIKQQAASEQEILARTHELTIKFLSNWNLEQKFSGVKQINTDAITEHILFAAGNYGLLPYPAKIISEATRKILQKLI